MYWLGWLPGAGVNYYFFNNNAFQSLGFIKIAIGIN